MADENTVEITFSADTSDALDGIAQVRDALTRLTAPVRALGGNLGELGNAFGAALPADRFAQAAQAFGALGQEAQRTAAQMREIAGEIKVLQEGFVEKKTLYEAEANQFQITQNQKFALLQAETQKEYEAQLALLQQELQIDNLRLVQRQDILNRIAILEASHRVAMLALDEQSIARQQQMWTSFLSALPAAFNTNLQGLLEGTTTWSQAFKNTLEQLLIKFIEVCEEMVVKWAAAELAQTTATTTGAAARAAANEAGAASGLVANAARALQAIMQDAAQTFAGVFAFLAPVMGPAAAGPAVAAQASVAAAAIFDVGTDYVVRGGLALIHPGETVIPAAQGSGPFTGTGRGASLGAQVHAPVNISVAAMDSQSVARFFNDNSKHMLRAINDAVRRGVHVGMRGAGP